MTRPAFFHTCTRENVARTISVLQAAGQHAHAELFRSVYAGEIALVNVTGRRQRIGNRDLAQTRKPVLVLVGDDDDKPTGPAGWRCARYLTAWAGAAVVHGSGATPDSYREAIRAATTTGRGLLVETSSVHVAAWAALLVGKPALCVMPRGGVHPVAPAAGQLH